jgi:hypothetical protein
MRDRSKLEYGVLVAPIKRDRSDTSVGWKLSILSIEPNEGVKLDGVVTYADDVAKVRNPLSGEKDPFCDLTFYAHVSWAYNQQVELGFYGLHYYSPYCVNLEDAERMVKMLKRVKKANAALPIEHPTFPQWVVLMASAIGVKYVVQERGGDASWHTRTQYYIAPVREAQRMLEREIDKLRKQIFPTPQEIAEAEVA